MTGRFAKVPEWLPVALRYAPREPRDATPANALAVFVELAMRADFRSWRVPIYWPVIAENCGISDRSARRAVALLRRIGAVTVDGIWATLVVDNPGTGGELPGLSGTGAVESGTGARQSGTGAVDDAHTRRSEPTIPAPQNLLQNCTQSPLMVVVADQERPPAPEWLHGDWHARLAAVRAMQSETDGGDTRVPDPGAEGTEDGRAVSA